jgi:uncharacterized membrane protein
VLPKIVFSLYSQYIRLEEQAVQCPAIVATVFFCRRKDSSSHATVLGIPAEQAN